MSVAISLAVGTVYGLYAFGSLGGNQEKYCLANQIDYHPYPYDNQVDMMQFLSRKGSENVSKKFDAVILYGFFSNFIFIFFQIYKMGLNYKQKNGI
jgi:hypothetical protein